MNAFTFLPYPSPKSAHRDPEIARQTYPLLSATLNSFSDYLYYSIIFSEIKPGLSALLESIAGTKLKHLKLISELIHYLGGNPAINARTITPHADISDGSFAADEAPQIVRALIFIEDESAARFADLAEKSIDNPAAAAVFSRLSSDSADNARLLRQAVI